MVVISESGEPMQLVDFDQRARLVRLCAAISRDPGAAEDLAQETLSVAWRRRASLRDPQNAAVWLNGIARNVCRGWLRGRRRAPQTPSHQSDDAPSIDPADDFDLELELERSELADLLDRAMARLPAATRAALVARVVDGLPQAEIARRLGTTEGAVEARLHRGKLLLRKVLTTELREDARAYGLLDPEHEWQQSRIWCPGCGQARLLGRFEGNSWLEMRCPCCCDAPDVSLISGGGPRFYAGVKGFRAAVSRLTRWAYPATHGVAPRSPGAITCWQCRAAVPYRIEPAYEPGVPAMMRGRLYLKSRCPGCGCAVSTLLAGNTICLPEGARFWRDHARLVLLPERVVEAAGGPAMVASLGDRGSAARLDVVFALDSLRVLKVQSDG
jgi:RNA polymerase sigma factor (sigma-70 family)